jgi:hypothetical protein
VYGTDNIAMVVVVGSGQRKYSGHGSWKVSPGTPFLEEATTKRGIIRAPRTKLGKGGKEVYIYST